jgi:S-adenosylmethionine decarboxylase proenzyme
MQGLHLTADLHGCPGGLALLADVNALRALCVREVERVGLRAVNALFHRFDASGDETAGITGVVLLAESHLAVHTWPELSAVTLDVYVCNFSADHGAAAEQLMTALIKAFDPADVERHALQRGTTAAHTA